MLDRDRSSLLGLLLHLLFSRLRVCWLALRALRTIRRPGLGSWGMSVLSCCGYPVPPLCPQVSITFDPFLYLPVPLPQKQKVLPVFYFAREPHSKPVKVRRPLHLALPGKLALFPC